MQNYELVFMIHPDCGEQISNMVNKYTEIVSNANGKVHRMENWGLRQLSYSVKKLRTAYYILLNIEIPSNIIGELGEITRFNDMIIRSIIIKTKCAITKPSPMMVKEEDSEINSYRRSNNVL